MSQQSQWPAGTADPWPATHPAGPSPSSARCHRSGQRAGTPALWTLEKNTITWTTRTSQLEQARAATALHSPNNRSFLSLSYLRLPLPPPPPPRLGLQQPSTVQTTGHFLSLSYLRLPPPPTFACVCVCGPVTCTFEWNQKKTSLWQTCNF